MLESGAASAKTIIAAGGHDHPVAATTIRRFDPTARVDSLGTANLIYGETDTLAGRQPGNLLAYSIPPSAAEGIACLGVHELTVAVAAVEGDAASFRSYLATTRLPGSPPATAGELNAPTGGRDAVIRRSLETASLECRRMLDAMDRAGVPRGAIYTTGGWSRSRAFVELRASIFGEPITVVDDMELTAIGAALFAAEAATGKSVCPIGKDNMTTIEPNPQWAAAYDRIYADVANG